MSDLSKKPGWRFAGIILVSLLMLMAFSYQQTLVYLAALWNDYSVGEYGHGYLVLAISAYLIISNRARLQQIEPCPCWMVLPLVFLSSMSWLVAVVVDVEVLQPVGLLLLVLTLVWSITGHQAIRLLAFPILFIVFAIPVWFPLSPILQDMTADIVFWLARILDIPAFRQENMIVLPAGIFSIEEACSGLRYLLAALTLGSLYAYINYVTLPARIAVVMLAAGAAVLANIVRVFIIVYVGYTTEMKHPWVTDHLMLGWYLFGGLVAIMLFLDSHFYRQGAVESQTAVAPSATMEPCEKNRVQMLLAGLLSVAMLMTGPALVYQMNNQQTVAVADLRVVMPEGADTNWDGPLNSGNDWEPHYTGSTSQKNDYRKADDVVSLYIAYYPRQKQGEEVINVKNSINGNWKMQYAHAQNVQLSDNAFKEQLIENPQLKKRLVWYWYNIGGQVTSNKYEAKVLQLAAMIKNRPQSYVVAVSIDVKENIENAREVLRHFFSDMKVQLGKINVAMEKG